MRDFVQWLETSFDEVDAADDVEDDDEWDDETDDEDVSEQPVDEQGEPAWMQWKRNIRAYAESAQPLSPTLPPNA